MSEFIGMDDIGAPSENRSQNDENKILMLVRATDNISMAEGQFEAAEACLTAFLSALYERHQGLLVNSYLNEIGMEHLQEGLTRLRKAKDEAKNGLDETRGDLK